MSLFWGRGTEQRSISYQDVWGSGGNVDLFNGTEGALRLIPLFAAHRTIIDAVAATPLHGYRARADGTAERLADEPDLISRPPFDRQVYGWKAQAVSSLLSDGNAFGLVTSLGRDGWPDGLLWLDPRKVALGLDDAHVPPTYLVEGRPVDSASIVHIPWVVAPGKWRGMSPLKSFMTAFEMGQAAQGMARDWFVNGAMPSGHLKTTGQLDPTAAAAAKTRWKAAIQGRDVFVSGLDWSYDAIGVPADEARFIETLKLSATQIASIYGIPPEEIGGETGHPMTYATVEGNEMRFAARVIRPWAVRIEEALSALMPRPVYCKFNLDANVRADLRTRMEAHEIAQRAGVETNAEARRLEDRPPLTEAERSDWLAMWHKPSTATPAPTKGQP